MSCTRFSRLSSVLLAAVMLIFTLALLFPAGAGTALAASGWQVQNSGTTNRLWDIDAVDGNTAWAVGDSSTILKTSNGGATWTAQASGDPNLASLKAVSVLNSSTAWAVGALGTILKTTDGGNTWTAQYRDGAITFTDVIAIDQNNVWAVGVYLKFVQGPNPDYWEMVNYAIISKTIDGGTSWPVQYLDKDNQICYGVTAANASTAWATTTKGIIKTTNAGASWSPEPGTSFMNSVAAIDASTVWAAGSDPGQNGMVQKTIDGGATWSKKLPGIFYSPFAVISAPSQDIAWATGGGGKIYKTADGGATWYLQSYHTSYALTGLCALDRNTVWAAGNGGVILRTTDGGGAGSPLARVDSIVPQQGPAGSEVSIKGWGFGATQGFSYVTLAPSAYYPPSDPRASTYTLWSNTEIRFRVPALDPMGYSVAVVVPITTPGWDDWIYSNGTGFTVTTGPSVTAINPASGVNNANYAVEVLGSGFQSGATARLVQGATVINGVGPTVTGPGRLTCYFDLNSKPLGKYDVIVRNPDSQEGKLAGGFSVTDPCGQGGGAAISLFAGMVGLLSLAGCRLRRKKGTKRI